MKLQEQTQTQIGGRFSVLQSDVCNHHNAMYVINPKENTRKA